MNSIGLASQNESRRPEIRGKRPVCASPTHQKRRGLRQQNRHEGGLPLAGQMNHIGSVSQNAPPEPKTSKLALLGKKPVRVVPHQEHRAQDVLSRLSNSSKPHKNPPASPKPRKLALLGKKLPVHQEHRSLRQQIGHHG